MLLTIDVGNTNISYGVFDGEQLVHHLRTESNHARTADEYAVLVRQMLSLRGVDLAEIDGAMVASVVPPLTDTIVAFVEMAFGCEPILVGPGIKTSQQEACQLDCYVLDFHWYFSKHCPLNLYALDPCHYQ